MAETVILGPDKTTVQLSTVQPAVQLGTLQTNVTIPGPIVISGSGASTGWVHPFSFGDATPIEITEVRNLSTIKIQILNPWNGTAPTLEIGDTALQNRLVQASQVNLKKRATWIVYPTYQYSIPTMAYLRLVASGATQGNGLIFMEW